MRRRPPVGGVSTSGHVGLNLPEPRGLTRGPRLLRETLTGSTNPPRRGPLHQRLPMPATHHRHIARHLSHESRMREENHERRADRKSTRLNSSHGYISYAVFCLKKKRRST